MEYVQLTMADYLQSKEEIKKRPGRDCKKLCAHRLAVEPD